MNEQRQISKDVRAALDHKIDTENLEQLQDWLTEQAKQQNLCWLLAHADDGVIWGRIDAGQLITSHEVAQHNSEIKKVCPPLRKETLQQARLFGKHAELLLWRDGNNHLQARLIKDFAQGEEMSKEPDWVEALDEAYLLWGTKANQLNNGFTLWRHGSEGLRHVVPCAKSTVPPKLHVRHYLAHTDHTYIECSRLCGLIKQS